MGTCQHRAAAAAIKRLCKIFERSEASLVHSLPIRKTIWGILSPTPVRVIEEAISSRTSAFSVRRPRDALWLTPALVIVGYRLAAMDPARPVYGIEQDPVLFAQAAANLQTLHASCVIDLTRSHLAEADYCGIATYEAGGLDFLQTGLVFNYPDGNQRRLARFISAHGWAETRLCILTHDRRFALDELELRVWRDVTVGAESSWRLSVYS